MPIKYGFTRVDDAILGRLESLNCSKYSLCFWLISEDSEISLRRPSDKHDNSWNVFVTALATPQLQELFVIIVVSSFSNSVIVSSRLCERLIGDITLFWSMYSNLCSVELLWSRWSSSSRSLRSIAW